MKKHFINSDSRKIGKLFDAESVDFVVTSPPYWAIEITVTIIKLVSTVLQRLSQ